ncbi:MAG TPA: DUF1501 domain-containing protein, partial [Luteolibacter sp.]
GGLQSGLNAMCGATDRASYALITDLKQRGLMEDTLVVWGGEFGRTTYSQGGPDGRDHHAKCFSVWLAGGGIKGGTAYGKTDDFAFNIADKSETVEVRDLVATIAHTLGIDTNRLHKRVLGLDQKATGVLPTRVVKEILA